MKFSYSKDLTLAYLDFMDWDKSIYNWSVKPSIPLTLLFGKSRFVMFRKNNSFSWKRNVSAAISNQKNRSFS
jgi:hypothetical protein